jgi:5-hydroxyisourate hydrolase-like protein (transthyretin family)
MRLVCLAGDTRPIGSNRATGVIVTMVACIVAAWVSAATPAEACSCIGLMPACQNAWMSDAVFVGRVMNITSVEGEQGLNRGFLRSRRVLLEVVEQFRGGDLLVPRDGASGVEVLTGQGGGDCGIAFKNGESYLVFATISKGTPTVLQTGLCNRTRELARAEEDLPYLRSLAALASSPPRGGRVYGYVELSDPETGRRLPGSGPPERKRLAEVKITLTEEGAKAGTAGVTKTTSTNTSGQYEFTDLAPGKYRVEAALPDSQYARGSGSTFAGELRDVRGCSEVNVYVSHDGRVSGRLLDARGKPVAGMTISLLGADELESPFQIVSFIKAMTNGDGAYELTKVPPGRYVVAINVERDFTTRQLLQPRIMHPGVEQTGDATTIDVGPGERVKLADWKMPPSRALVIVRGTVTTADGQPAAGVSVWLAMEADRSLRRVGGDTVTDAKGQFGLSALEGQRYRLQAHRQTTTPSGGAGSAGDIKTKTIYENATSEAFVTAADAPWLTLRLETKPQTP